MTPQLRHCAGITRAATAHRSCVAPVFLCNLGIIPLIVVNTYSLAQYQNIGDARIQGTEFDLNYDAGSWFVGVSGQRIRGTDETNGQPLITVQPDQVATTFGVRLYDRKLTAAIRWAAVASKSADQIPDRDNDGIPDFLPTASYNLVNFYLGYTPSDNVTASFGIENLLNEYYIPYLAGTPNTTAGNGFVFPGPGITYKAGLQVRFGAM